METFRAEESTPSIVADASLSPEASAIDEIHAVAESNSRKAEVETLSEAERETAMKADAAAKDFEWLEDLNTDSSTALKWILSAKTFDFGSKGYTASVTDFWHDMLQMTAPDERCDIVYVRGDFPDDPGAVLARAQTYLRHRSWGLRHAKSYGYKDFIAQSLINHRWPYTQYDLKIKGHESGTYTICSFVKDATVYQVVRLRPGGLLAKDSQASSSKPQETKPDIPMKFTLGGNIRFGCVCSLGQRQGDEYTRSTSEDGLQYSCTSSRYKKKLTMQIFSNGKGVDIRKLISNLPPSASAADPYIAALDGHPSWDQKWTSMSVPYVEYINPDKPTVIVAAFALRESEDNTPLAFMNSEEVEDYLGVSETSKNATKRLWDACKTSQDKAVDFRDITAIARSFEIISNVTSFTLKSNPVLDWKAKTRELLETLDAKNSHIDPSKSTANETDSVDHDIITDNESRHGLLRVEQSTSELKSEVRSQTKITQKTTSPVASVKELDPTAPPSTEENYSHHELPNAYPTSPRSSPNLRPQDPSPNVELQYPTGLAKDAYYNILQDSSIALIDNLVTSLETDLCSSFWQLRLLVKVHRFLAIQSFARSDMDRTEPLTAIYQEYNQKILSTIRGVLIWLLSSPLEQKQPLTQDNSQDEPRYRRLECETRPKDTQEVNIQACWITMAVWYTCKHCWEAAAPVLRIRVLSSYLVKLANIDVHPTSSKGQETEHAFLQWHHHNSLLQICGEIQKLDPHMLEVSGLKALQTDIEVKAERCQSNIRRIVNPTKKARSHKFSSQQELEDRLALFSGELQSGPDSATLLTDCRNFVQGRINSRSPTIEINPGRLNRQDLSTEASTDSPWELLCLNHHTALCVSDDESKVEASKDCCYQFQMSDYSVISTWNESDKNMIGSWWNVEVNSVLCSTLIDLQKQGRNNDQKDEPNSPTVNETSRARPFIQTSQQAVLQDLQPSEAEQILFFNRSQAQMTSRNTHTKPYIWTEAQPNLIYYPVSWLQSLDDIPKALFHEKQTKNLSLRKRIRDYISKKDSEKVLQPPEWDMDNVKDKIPPRDLLFLSVFDLVQETDMFRLVTNGRADQSQLRTFFDPNDDASGFSSNSDSDDNGDETPRIDNSLQVWSILLNVYSVESIPPTNLLHEHKTRLLDPKQRGEFAKRYQQNLFNKLNDSMVDCGVKYRVLYAERCCPTQVAAFMYMWHPDGIDGFDDYFGTISRFSDVLDSNSTWTTTINLSYWGFLSDNISDDADQKFGNLPEYMQKSFDEDRTSADFPPGHVLVDSRNVRTTTSHGFLDPIIASWQRLARKDSLSSKGDTGEEETKLDRKMLRVQERSSCLVITGDDEGRFWTCSMWSSLIDERTVADYMTKVQFIMQSFIHQQPVGRGMVFIYLLGYICEKLAEEYKFFIDRLEDFVKLGQKVFLYGDGLDLEGDGAVFQLKQMLWGLEALRILEAKLRSSTTEIRRAFETVTEKARSQPGQRHSMLERELREILQDFKKQQESLEDYQNIIRLKIEQLTGLRDGTSTVTNMIDAHQAARDGQTAIKQGNNIRVLTLLTIIYLPLGFVTGLFQMGHGVIPDNAGSRLFTGLIFIFLLGTLGIAPWVIQAIDGIWEGARATQAERKHKDKIVRLKNEGLSDAEKTPSSAEQSFITDLKKRLKGRLYHEHRPQNVVEVPVMLSTDGLGKPTNGMGSHKSTSKDAGAQSITIDNMV